MAFATLSKITFIYLEYQNIPFKDQVSVIGPNGYQCYYDFEVYHQEKTTVIEIDGRGHFEDVPFFRGTDEDYFLKSRKRDIYKHYVALKNGKNIIRIEYDGSTKHIMEHIDKGLENNEREYFSDPSMYQWLIDGVKKLVDENMK